MKVIDDKIKNKLSLIPTRKKILFLFADNWFADTEEEKRLCNLQKGKHPE